MVLLENNSWSQPASGGLKSRVVRTLMSCTGPMQELHTHMQDGVFPLRLADWCLRGISQVILLNNPLSGALIGVALVLESPWQALLGTFGLLTSTFTAIILGMDSEEISSGIYGFNGMLVALLMGVFSSAGHWFWWLLLPVGLGAAATTILYSCLAPILVPWNLPVSVFPFNTVIVLYLACMGSTNTYFPNYPALPPGAQESINHTQLHIHELLQGVVLGVGQIFTCETLGPSLLILAAIFLFSPILAMDAILGSVVGTLAGLSMSVQHSLLYSGLAGFNGALGCITVGMYFVFNWKTQLLSIISALLSGYSDIGLSNILGQLGLPASSWAATLTGTMILLVTGELKKYRIPAGQVTSPELNLLSHKQWSAASTEASEVV